jgi:hypothetical protein
MRNMSVCPWIPLPWIPPRFPPCYLAPLGRRRRNGEVVVDTFKTVSSGLLQKTITLIRSVGSVPSSLSRALSMGSTCNKPLMSAVAPVLREEQSAYFVDFVP